MTTALIAEDEPLLAQALRAELARAWPGLQLLDTAVDGDDAVERALEGRPDIVFLDIRMPGRTGLEAAEAIVEEWPANAAALPLIVFVTAYDQYAMQAFERAAVAYLQNPVQPARLAACCARLKDMIALRAAANERAGVSRRAGRRGACSDACACRCSPRRSQATERPQAPLTILQASIGPTLHMIRVDEVV